MRVFLPTNEISTFWYRPCDLEGRPSYSLRVMVDGTNVGDPKSFQILVDIMYVNAPSLITQ